MNRLFAWLRERLWITDLQRQVSIMQGEIALRMVDLERSITKAAVTSNLRWNHTEEHLDHLEQAVRVVLQHELLLVRSDLASIESSVRQFASFQEFEAVDFAVRKLEQDRDAMEALAGHTEGMVAEVQQWVDHYAAAAGFFLDPSRMDRLVRARLEQQRRRPQ